jgi:hypothetical protein
MKRKVMKMAWAIVARFNSFADALRHAWKVVKLSAKMRNTVVPFLYKKVDGSTRLAAGTLQADLLPPVKGAGNKAEKWDLLTYFDAEVKQWRSCKVENIIWNT